MSKEIQYFDQKFIVSKLPSGGYVIKTQDGSELGGGEHMYIPLKKDSFKFTDFKIAVEDINKQNISFFDNFIGNSGAILDFTKTGSVYNIHGLYIDQNYTSARMKDIDFIPLWVVLLHLAGRSENAIDSNELSRQITEKFAKLEDKSDDSKVITMVNDTIFSFMNINKNNLYLTFDYNTTNENANNIKKDFLKYAQPSSQSDSYYSTKNPTTTTTDVAPPNTTKPTNVAPQNTRRSPLKIVIIIIIVFLALVFLAALLNFFFPRTYRSINEFLDRMRS